VYLLLNIVVGVVGMVGIALRGQGEI